MQINSDTRKFQIFSSKKIVEIYKPQIGSFKVIDGNRIYYMPEKGVKEPNLIVYLLSNVFAYILYQRNFLVLHASAINIKGKSYFFSGWSGVGKSTLLNNLSGIGALISEDVVCISASLRSIFQSLPFIKLSSDHKIKNFSEIYKTQTDKRKRFIYSVEYPKFEKNKFSAGFFLSIGKENSVKKVSGIKLFQNILSNSFISHPITAEDQIDILNKSKMLFEKNNFYLVTREKNKDFSIEEIISLIKEN